MSFQDSPVSLWDLEFDEMEDTWVLKLVVGSQLSHAMSQ